MRKSQERSKGPQPRANEIIKNHFLRTRDKYYSDMTTMPLIPTGKERQKYYTFYFDLYIL